MLFVWVIRFPTDATITAPMLKAISTSTTLTPRSSCFRRRAIVLLNCDTTDGVNHNGFRRSTDAERNTRGTCRSVRTSELDCRGTTANTTGKGCRLNVRCHTPDCFLQGVTRSSDTHAIGSVVL